MDTPPLPIPESYWVIPGRLLAGEYPGGFGEARVRLRMDAFLDAGITAFINLTEDDELPSYEAILRDEAQAYGMDVRVRNFPIRDRDLPTREVMSATLDAIAAALDSGCNVYVHCWGGVGRTGLTVGCFLVRRGMTGDEALAQIAQWWEDVPMRASFPRSPETDEQVQFIREWR